MAEHIATLGTALCTAAVATALLGFVSGGAGGARMLKVASGVYAILIVLTGVSGVVRDSGLPRELEEALNAGSVSYADAYSAPADDLLRCSEEVLDEKLERALGESGISASVDSSLSVTAEGEVALDGVVILLAHGDDAPAASAEIERLCGVRPALYTAEGRSDD